MENLSLHVEALIFTSESPIKTVDIQKALLEALSLEVSVKDIEASIKEVQEKYQSAAFAMQVVEINGGYEFLTKKDFHDTIRVFNRQKANRKLSTSAMETLAIIAYKNPITKAEMEQIRGVNCDYTVQKLLEKELISILGKKDAPGRPLMYGISDKFMEHFGLRSLNELPQLKDFKQDENQIGIHMDVEEDTE